MLRQIGVASTEKLFDSIPESLRLREHLNVPAAMSELELLKWFEEIGARNQAAQRTGFLGGGAYSHYTPTIVDHLISRSEFFTAYTPYQPEISQGTLQAIFEFQTLVCQLTGMDIANASMYGGAKSLSHPRFIRSISKSPTLTFSMRESICSAPISIRLQAKRRRPRLTRS